MSKRGENIYKRKDGRWEGRCSINETGKFKCLYGRSYKEVKGKMLQYQSNIESEKSILQKPPSFSTVCNDWLAACEPTIKESTYVKYYNTIKNHIKPYFEKQELYEITVENLSEFVSLKLMSEKPNEQHLSVVTVKAILKIMDSIFKYAVSKKYILYYPSFKGVSLPKSKTYSTQILSHAEQEILTAYILSEPDRFKVGILLCLYTGIRLGEICALKWENINLSTKILYVNKTMQRIQNIGQNSPSKTKVIESTPKTHSSIREIPIPDFLAAHMTRYQSSEENAYMLTGEKERFVEPRSFENLFKKYIANCKIQKINFHSLRHTFATNCVEVGFDVKSLSEILGHSNVQTTLNRYVHPTMESKRNNMNLLTRPYV